MSRCDQYTLAEATDRYLQLRGIDKKKYFSKWITVAADVHRDLFRNTFWNVKSVWRPVTEDGTGWNISIPKDCTRFLSAAVLDDCHHIEELFYNARLNVVKKPVNKKCKCDSCDCAGTCEAMNSLTVTTKLLFTVSGQDYYEKTWLQTCPNGDVIKWSEIPTKKYNNMIGDAGDFNDDYNDDYSHAAAPFSDYEIETVIKQEIICKLETLPCGCPADTPENAEIINNFCGCFINWNCGWKKKCCDDFLGEINSDHRGEVKMGPCNTKLYYFPQRSFRGQTIKIPKYLLLNYQTNGRTLGQETLVPDYAWNCLWSGMDYYGKRFHDRYSRGEKKELCYVYEDEKNKIIMFLNPMDLNFLREIQDAKIQW